MKNYTIKVELEINHGPYGTDVDFKKHFTESIPEGVEPLTYLKSRLGEEIKRHAPTLSFDYQKEGSNEL